MLQRCNELTVWSTHLLLWYTCKKVLQRENTHHAVTIMESKVDVGLPIGYCVIN